MSDQPANRQAPVTRVRLTPAQKAAQRPKSAHLAIAAFCYQCKGGNDEHPHLTKALVRDCAKTQCALWLHRGWKHITTRRTLTSNPKMEPDGE